MVDLSRIAAHSLLECGGEFADIMEQSGSFGLCLCVKRLRKGFSQCCRASEMRKEGLRSAIAGNMRKKSVRVQGESSFPFL
ncbi:hypothetical protein AGATL06_08050 [Agathobaculum sp. TL06]